MLQISPWSEEGTTRNWIWSIGFQTFSVFLWPSFSSCEPGIALPSEDVVAVNKCGLKEWPLLQPSLSLSLSSSSCGLRNGNSICMPRGTTSRKLSKCIHKEWQSDAVASWIAKQTLWVKRRRTFWIPDTYRRDQSSIQSLKQREDSIDINSTSSWSVFVALVPILLLLDDVEKEEWRHLK